MVRTVGFFTELDLTKPNLYSGSILDVVRDSPGIHENEMVHYLESGIALIDIMEGGRDVIVGGLSVLGCSSVLTDGAWVWRLDLPYYVGKYHLELDSEFTGHVARNNYIIPDLPEFRVIEIARYVMRDILNMSTIKPPALPEWPPKS